MVSNGDNFMTDAVLFADRVALPDPFEGFGEGLGDDFAVHVTGGRGEDVAILFMEFFSHGK